jgi:hypothetical protein
MHRRGPRRIIIIIVVGATKNYAHFWRAAPTTRRARFNRDASRGLLLCLADGGHENENDDDDDEVANGPMRGRTDLAAPCCRVFARSCLSELVCASASPLNSGSVPKRHRFVWAETSADDDDEQRGRRREAAASAKSKPAGPH